MPSTGAESPREKNCFPRFTAHPIPRSSAFFSTYIIPAVGLYCFSLEKVLGLLVVDDHDLELEGVFPQNVSIVLSIMLRVLSECHPTKVEE